jgi:hypothetical protein
MITPTWNGFDAQNNLASEPDGNSPIFVLAAGWRSGSTLVQRMLVSSHEAIIWGEPYGRSGLIQALTGAACGLTQDWPQQGHFGTDAVFSQPENHWIANLFPPAHAMKEALLSPLYALLEQPARDLGFNRFGLKEVRLQALHARFLQWAYPSARFVFLVRNPYDAWLSARGMGLLSHWSGPVMDDAAKFAAHWTRLASSFLQWQDEAGVLIQYENLHTMDLQGLADHCRLSHIDSSVLDSVCGGVTKSEKPPLTCSEEAAIRKIAGPTAAKFGYFGPSAHRRADTTGLREALGGPREALRGYL